MNVRGVGVPSRRDWTRLAFTAEKWRESDGERRGMERDEREID